MLEFACRAPFFLAVNGPGFNCVNHALFMKDTRRQFLQTTAIVASAFRSCPGTCWAVRVKPRPAKSCNIAGIGVGGMGQNNLRACAGGEHRGPVRRGRELRRQDLRRISQGQGLPGFPPDARTAKGHRRRHRGHARSHARRDRAGGHAGRQARLCPKADDPFGARGPRADRGGARAQGRAPRWATRGIPGDGTRLVCEWIAAGCIGAGARGPRLDQSARLAAGRGGRAAQGNPARPGGFGLGPVARPGPRPGLITPLTCPAPGGRGGISAPARSATWAATSSTRPSGP